MTAPQLDGRRAWTIAVLLFASQIINYFDKNVMGLAAPSIIAELGLTAQQYGLVASSFFALYAVSGVTVGMVVAQRVGSKPLLAALVLIWSLAQLPVVFAPTLGVLILGRVLLGIGEGPASPTATSAALEWFSPENRNMPAALLMLGSSLGSVIAAPVLAHVMAGLGWRAGFLLCGALGLVWLAVWLMLGASGPRVAEIDPGAADAPAIAQGRGVARPVDPRLHRHRLLRLLGGRLLGGVAGAVRQVGARLRRARDRLDRRGGCRRRDRSRCWAYPMPRSEC